MGKSLSFRFDNFSANELDLILQDDAILINNALQLTGPNQQRVGRALYCAPVRLWDNASTMVSSFETTFTFVISKTDPDPLADGLTFFMTSADDTAIPPNSDGMYLGVFGPNGVRDHVVAVEFDTFPNPEVHDPDSSHIGIDVQSIESVVTAPWTCQRGRVATAYISYNSASNILTVATAYHDGNPDGNPVTLSHEVELNTVLPEWVRLGFSASTGYYTQETAILSWSFTSTLIDKPN